MFFDEAKIHVRAGDGGNGCSSFRREKYVPRGGPDGGNGGRGGRVYVAANRHLNTLIAFQRRRHFKAGQAGHGQNQKKQGANGDDCVIDVPPGTTVRDASTGQLLGDLVSDEDRVLVAKGGRGGRGNAVFAGPTNQAPRTAERGEPGEARWLELELKLIADVGIIGCPNAGKSTLLSVVSAARPKIADYPFTTLVPNLGVAEVDDRTLVLADIPGLIEGAHAGAGLGHQFLRHIERTRVLIHLLDGLSDDPLKDMHEINRELALYSQPLSRTLQVVALNKMDIPQVQELWPRLREELKKRDIQLFAISAVTGQGTLELLRSVTAIAERAPRYEADIDPIVVFRPHEEMEEAFDITQEVPGTFRVRGTRIERAAVMTEWSIPDGVARFQRILRADGIWEALEKNGVKVGDTVFIGDVELVWE